MCWSAGSCKTQHFQDFQVISLLTWFCDEFVSFETVCVCSSNHFLFFFVYIIWGKTGIKSCTVWKYFFKNLHYNWVQLEALYPWPMLGVSETSCAFQGLYIRVKTQNAVTESLSLFLSPPFPKAVTVQRFILKHFYLLEIFQAHKIWQQTNEDICDSWRKIIFQ